VSAKDDVALAKVGIRALIDEATGYQGHRATDDLTRYADELGLNPAYLKLIIERTAEILGQAQLGTGDR